MVVLMNLLHARCCGALEPRCVPGVLALHGLCGRPALSTLRKWQGFAYPGHPTLTVLGSIVKLWSSLQDCRKVACPASHSVGVC